LSREKNKIVSTSDKRRPVSPKQADFIINSTSSYNIMWGVVSSGKTYIQIWRWIIYVMTEAPPGCLLLMTGKTSGALWVNCIRQMLQIMPSWQYTERPGTIRIPQRDIEITCVGAWNDRDWERVSGGSFAGWFSDESTLAPQNFMQICIKSIRVAPRLKFWSFNPDHPQHWIKINILDNPEIDCKSWFFTFDDNETLTEQYKKETAAAFSGLFYRRYILGEWVAFEGVVFPDWNDEDRIVATFNVPAHWLRARSIDFGYVLPRHAFVCQWWAAVPPGENVPGTKIYGPAWVMYRELYTGNMLNEDLGKMIEQYSKNDPPSRLDVADHDQEGIETLRRYGMSQLIMAEKGTKIEQVREVQQGIINNTLFFMKDALINVPRSELTSIRKPTRTVEEFPVLEWDMNRYGEIMKEEPKDEYDHGFKTTAYLLLSAKHFGFGGRNKGTKIVYYG